MTTRATLAKGGGGYAEKIAIPASHLVRIPDGVSFEQAVAAGLTSSTAWGGLFDLGHLQAGERVLIWAGSSGVGSIAIQLAKHAAAWVATTASSNERAEALRKLGADLVINHREQDVAKVLGYWTSARMNSARSGDELLANAKLTRAPARSGASGIGAPGVDSQQGRFASFEKKPGPLQHAQRLQGRRGRRAASPTGAPRARAA